MWNKLQYGFHQHFICSGDIFCIYASQFIDLQMLIQGRCILKLYGIYQETYITELHTPLEGVTWYGAI